MAETKKKAAPKAEAAEAPAAAEPKKAKKAKKAVALEGPHARLQFLRMAPRKVRLVADHGDRGVGGLLAEPLEQGVERAAGG